MCDIGNMAIACCIVHNTIIEDERHHNLSYVLKPMCDENKHQNLNFEKYLQRQVEIQNRDLHLLIKE